MAAAGYGSQANPVTLDSHSDEEDDAAPANSRARRRNPALADHNDDDDCVYMGIKATATEIATPEPPPLAHTASAAEDDSSPPPESLSPEQLAIVDLVDKGENVFFSGPGGTGKSFVLRHIIHRLERIHTGFHCKSLASESRCCCFPCNVAVTAPTGIAALELGGTTLHAAARIGIPLIPDHFGRMWDVRDRWRNLRVWIVDEVSMVSAEMLDYLEQTICKMRQAHVPDDEKLPFGGLQVIFAGDFFQLLPVVDEPSGTAKVEFLNRGLAFESRAWRTVGLKIVLLKQVFRQEDREFVSMLNDIRTGADPGALHEIERRCSRPLPAIHGILPTRLYPKNSSVDRHNRTELAKLPDAEVLVVARDSVTTKEQKLHVRGDYMSRCFNEQRHREQYDRLREHSFWDKCRAAKEVKLKTSAQVMLLWNLDLNGPKSKMLVNGSRGIVVGWKTKHEELEELELCLQKYDEQAMGSKTPAAGGNENENADANAKFRTRARYENLKRSAVEFVPVVRFRNGRVVNCGPEAFTHEVLNVGECTRLQVPLKLAWALTIHKSQGMSLDYAHVWLQDVRDDGQAYVALSRVRSLEGLQVVRSNQINVVKCNERVKRFYEALEKRQEPPEVQLTFQTLEFQFQPSSQEEADPGPATPPISSLKREPPPPQQPPPPGPFEACNLQALAGPAAACYHCRSREHWAFACPKRPRIWSFWNVIVRERTHRHAGEF